MNYPSYAGIALLLALPLSSCDRKKKYGIEYEQSSLEQTVEATASAFAGSSLKIETEPEIEAFFTRMGRASRLTGPFDVADFISVDAMLETAESAGLLAGMSIADRRNFRKGFHKGLTSHMPASLRQMAYDRHRIARVEKPSENRRVVFANHYDNELNVATPVRWWLVRTERGWRIHDFEDLSVGLGVVGMMGIMMKAGIATNPEPWIKDFVPLMESFKSIDMGDPESLSEFREPVERLLKHNLPTDIRRFASTVLAGAYLAAGENDKAEQELLAARKGGYESPMAHYQMGHALMRREEYRMALDEFDLHIATMGEDSDILESVSDCHFQLGEMDEARAAAERALDDNPSALNCLASLVAASTKEQLVDETTTARFKASGDPAAGYEIALDYLISLEEIEKAKLLYETGRETFEDQDLLDYYDGEFTEPGEE